MRSLLLVTPPPEVRCRFSSVLSSGPGGGTSPTPLLGGRNGRDKGTGYLGLQVWEGGQAPSLCHSPLPSLRAETKGPEPEGGIRAQENEGKWVDACYATRRPVSFSPHAHAHKRAYTHTCIYMHAFTCVQTHSHTCTPVRAPTHVQRHSCMYPHVCTCAHVHTSGCLGPWAPDPGSEAAPVPSWRISGKFPQVPVLLYPVCKVMSILVQTSQDGRAPQDTLTNAGRLAGTPEMLEPSVPPRREQVSQW